jgi:hypothetical protein
MKRRSSSLSGSNNLPEQRVQAMYEVVVVATRIRVVLLDVDHRHAVMN